MTIEQSKIKLRQTVQLSNPCLYMVRVHSSRTGVSHYRIFAIDDMQPSIQDVTWLVAMVYQSGCWNNARGTYAPIRGTYTSQHAPDMQSYLRHVLLWKELTVTLL
jgi:hypothetical protein